MKPRRVGGIGARVGHARRVYGLTNLTDYGVADLARDVNVRHQTIARIENGQRGVNPTDELLMKIARKLGVTVAWLRYGGPIGAPRIQDTMFPDESEIEEPARYYYGKKSELEEPGARRKKGAGGK